MNKRFLFKAQNYPISHSVNGQRIRLHAFTNFIKEKLFLFICFAFGIAYALISLSNILVARNITDQATLSDMRTLNTVEMTELSRHETLAISRKSSTFDTILIELAKASTEAILLGPRSCLDCELRLVYLSIVETGKLSEDALESLRYSYDLSPYGDVDVMKWRLTVSSKYWNDLPVDLQTSAMSQVTGLSLKQENIVWLRSFQTNVTKLRMRIEKI